ncbi:MAG TPA: hypothetical protein VM512_10480 [Burkholderiaceae bacterium]|jgi:hypothetical protein|nr:hypothetical protein [Burkholderiaceae bacterium]
MQQLDHNEQNSAGRRCDLGFNPNAAIGEQTSHLIAAISRGDLDAIRELRDRALSFIGPDVAETDDALAIASWGVMAARMAASRGDQIDAERLALILGWAGDVFRHYGMTKLAGDHYVECLGLCDRLAAIGSAAAGLFAGNVAASLPPIVMQEAMRVSQPEIQ